MTGHGPQPTDIRLMIPRRCLDAWAEVRVNIAMRLSVTRAEPMDEVPPGLIVAELLRIGLAHIHGEGYPMPGDLLVKAERHRALLHELRDLAEVIEAKDKVIEAQGKVIDAQGKRLAALDGREPDAGV